MPQHDYRFSIDYYGRGYLGAPPVPKDLRLPRDHLDDPWLVCALALERAKQGDFSWIPALLELYGATNEVALDNMCLGLLADAGTAACFANLVKRVKREQDAGRIFDSCGALAVRGELSYVPLLLEKYFLHQGKREAERLVDYIHLLVGDSLYPIEADGYEDAVMSSYWRMLSEFKDEKVLVFQGERYGIVRLAKYVLRNVESPYFSLRWKLAFEAATGIDCSAWYRDQKLRPATAAATLEEFLAGRESAGYHDGIRYFFGHRIDGG